jgi:DNA (cytosine-5)-methyltransferase 1
VTFGELFAGIGGFSLGLERAGMTCKWQVEIDPYATAVLNKHWPDVPKHDDVRTFPPTHDDYSVDLICGGFPCQDISVAGKGAGLAGERSGLWHEFARIIGEIRPRYVVVENVAALLTRGMDVVLGTLATLGYDAEWHVIPASAVGAPHRRERVWIIAYANDKGQSDVPVHDEQGRGVPELAGGDVSDAVSQRDAVRRDGSPCEKGVAGRDCNAGGSECDCGPRCAGQAGQGAGDVADAENDRHQERTRLRADRKRFVSAEQGIACRSACGSSKSRRRGGNVSDANCAGRQQQRRTEPVPAEQPAAECGGWWESEPDVGRVAHGVSSRVDRLRCLGNAVVPQVVEVIGRAILEAEARMTS